MSSLTTPRVLFFIAVALTILVVLWLGGVIFSKKESFAPAELETARSIFDELAEKVARNGEGIPGDDGTVDPENIIALVTMGDGPSATFTPPTPHAREGFGYPVSPLDGFLSRTYPGLRELSIRPDAWGVPFRYHPSFFRWPPHLWTRLRYWGPAVTSGLTWGLKPGALLRGRPPRSGWVRFNGNTYAFLNNSGFD